MKKYIKDYFKINESIGRGSIIIIKGKSENDKKKLYATHIVGHSQLDSGATMLFLSDDFYRIKKDGDKLKTVKVSFSSEESLKKAVNSTSAGKISVVKNNNKTPWHWITLKHTNLISALRELEDKIDSADYLLEAVDPKESLYQQFYDYFVPKAVRTLFLDTNEVMILSTDTTTPLEDELDHDEPAEDLEFEVNCRAIDRSVDIQRFIDELGIVEPVDISIDLNSDITYGFTRGEAATRDYPGTADSYYVKQIKTHIFRIWVNGEIVPFTDSISYVVNSVNSSIENLTDSKIESLVLKNSKELHFYRENDF